MSRALKIDVSQLQDVKIFFEKLTSELAKVSSERDQLAKTVETMKKEVKANKASADALQSEAVRKCEAAVDLCKKTEETTKSYASAVSRHGATGTGDDKGWQTVGTKRSHAFERTMQQIRIVSTKPEAVVPATNAEALDIAQKYVGIFGTALPGAIMNVRVEKAKSEGNAPGRPRAIVIDMPKVHAESVVTSTWAPEHSDKLGGWKAMRHLSAIEYRCKQALWDQYKTELQHAISTKERFRYLDDHTGIQIGFGPKLRLSKEKLKGLGVVC